MDFEKRITGIDDLTDFVTGYTPDIEYNQYLLTLRSLMSDLK